MNKKGERMIFLLFQKNKEENSEKEEQFNMFQINT